LCTSSSRYGMIAIWGGKVPKPAGRENLSTSKAVIRPISERRRKDMVEDLVRKYPYGPRGRKRGLGKEHYSVTERYSSFHNGYRMLTMLISKKEGESFGYTNLDIYKLHFRFPSDVRDYIRQNWPTLSTMAISKRSNRIWVRIQNAVNEIRSVGSTGIYRVQFGAGRQAYIHANSTADAVVYAEAMLKVPLRAEQGYSARANFQTIGDALMLAGKNTEVANDWRSCARNKVKDLEVRLAKAQAALEETEISAAMIESLAGFQIAEMESVE
jgi:hypothetical protein